MGPQDQKALAERIVAAQIALAGDAVFRALFAAGVGDATDAQIALLLRLPIESSPGPNAAGLTELTEPEVERAGPTYREVVRADRVHAMARAIVSSMPVGLTSGDEASAKAAHVPIAEAARHIVDAVDAELARGAA